MPLEVATYQMDSKVTLGAGSADEVQVITLAGATAGTFTITFDGETTGTIAYNASAATVQTALLALSNLVSGDVVVTGSNGGPYTLTFGGNYADTNVPAVTCDASSLTGTNEVQRVTITGTPTGGDFTLTYSGQTTAPIAYDATAGTVATALVALSNIGVGEATGSGGPLPGSAVDITFSGTLGEQDLTAMTANGAGLTGGSSPAVAITTPTPGADGTATPSTSTGGSAGGTTDVQIPDNIHADARNADALHNTTGDTPEDIFAT